MSNQIVSAETLRSDPSFFLWRVDARQRRLVFLKVDPETFDASVFLDDRIAHERGQVLSVSLDEFTRAA
ncbi:MAG: hypothetical protein R3200_12580 [Xanthomonadales bacterium]|nr:hypothetical protein [Xanthomonadales bacterium]